MAKEGTQAWFAGLIGIDRGLLSNRVKKACGGTRPDWWPKRGDKWLPADLLPKLVELKIVSQADADIVLNTGNSEPQQTGADRKREMEIKLKELDYMERCKLLIHREVALDALKALAEVDRIAWKKVQSIAEQMPNLTTDQRKWLRERTQRLREDRDVGVDRAISKIPAATI